MSEINVKIIEKDGVLFVSSRDIAVGMEKEHRHVLGKIKEVLNEPEYRLVKYVDAAGRNMPEYLLPKDSFILLLFNYQGYNDFKRAYIKRFEEMEHSLRKANNIELVPFKDISKYLKIAARVAEVWDDGVDKGTHVLSIDSDGKDFMVAKHRAGAVHFYPHSCDDIDIMFTRLSFDETYNVVTCGLKWLKHQKNNPFVSE